MQDCVKDLMNAINQYDSNDKDSINRLRDLVCSVSDNGDLRQDPFIASLLYTASQKMRVFGYNTLNNFSSDPAGYDSDLGAIRNSAIKNLYRSKVNSNNILDKSQMEVVDTFQNISPRRLLVSAPTS